MNPGQPLKTVTSKTGKTVVIRYLQGTDLDNLLMYVNNLIDEDTFVMLSGEHIKREDEEKYLKDSLKAVEDGKKIHLTALVDGVFASSAEVRRHDRRSLHVGEIGISIAKAFRGEGIGSMMMHALIDEAKKLGLRLLVLNCFENNDRAMRLYEKFGFQKAGIVPGMFIYKQAPVGEVRMYLAI